MVIKPETNKGFQKNFHESIRQKIFENRTQDNPSLCFSSNNNLTPWELQFDFNKFKSQDWQSLKRPQQSI